jgi:uncharacterized membrane protein
MGDDLATRFLWFIARIGRRLWFRVALFALLGIASALLSIWLAPLVPADISARIGAEAVDAVLGIIASSMLTVTIFSLSTMVSAYSAAASAATPRATQLLQQDSSALNALGTFIGAFLFSLVGIIALSTGVYGSSGRLILFVVTIGVVIAVVITFIGWIDRLSSLGRMGETIDCVADAASDAVAARRAAPSLGAAAARAIPPNAHPVRARVIGYVQHVDLAALEAAACDGAIDVAAVPGSFVSDGRPLVFLETEPDETTAKAIRDAFIVEARRSFDQDPRFGVIVLSEIASRALSPAVNDPGTAIDVMAALTRVLASGRDDEPQPVRFPRIHLPAIDPAEVLEDCIMPIARDGAGLVEVGLRLQRTLRAIADLPHYAVPARLQARGALARGLAALSSEEDRARLRGEALWLEA